METTKHIGHSAESSDVAELHTPEPWREVDIINSANAWVYADEIAVAKCRDDKSGQRDARRIVACVNACTGIPTYQLFGVDNEPINLGEIIDSLRSIINQG